MRSLYLIRHTTPNVGPGICYGQSDIDVSGSFNEEAGSIKAFLPPETEKIYSSPLIRCRKLAEHLFPNQDIHFRETLMEINCGRWEMRRWNDIPRQETEPWMNDFVHMRIPGGESYTDLHKRVTQCFDEIVSAEENAVIVSHGGVIRSMLCHITKASLADSFNLFSIHCGCVIKIFGENGGFRHEIISNTPAKKESHKPSYS